MKLLVVGGGGYVGSIVEQMLEREHICTHFDRKPMGHKARSMVGDVTDPLMAHRAVQDMDSVLYMPLGVRPGTTNDVNDPAVAFDVHVRGFYEFLRAGLKAGVRRFIYISTMDVYSYKQTQEHPIREQMPAAAFSPYGLSKRLGELVGEAAVQHRPETTVVSARLYMPKNDRDWKGSEAQASTRGDYVPGRHPLGPNDTRRLFAALLAFDRPGYYVFNAAGDPSGEVISHAQSRELLGWQPQGD